MRLWDVELLIRWLVGQGLANGLGFALHEGLHLWTALNGGVSAGAVKVSWFRFWVLES